MNVVLWIIQILLAVVFAGAGAAKLTQPKDKLRELMRWVDPVPPTQVKLLGAVELLAAIGLVLPPLTGIATVLTPLAAVGLVIVMIGGILVHLRDMRQQDTQERRRMEIQGAITCAVLLVLAAVVAWGRFGPYSF
ncbi:MULTISPECIES: DoxX family protein [unclassified Micromonospora]|uniref:DoxX family protein n=1 Tax=unclassified Micromonospora TaxID=2617518 RepID=UPI000EF557E3|nr:MULTISPECIES: DoxX family protein [unclassified Micromonospora]RLP93007.1 DoxX family protein [Micromonospora sp. BL4]RLP96543.1 DoxX family protein [Micromonospora sp. CV4]